MVIESSRIIFIVLIATVFTFSQAMWFSSRARLLNTGLINREGIMIS